MYQQASFNPVQLFRFLSQTRDSLPDDSEFSELSSLLLTPSYMLPKSQLITAALPYLERASDPSLKSTFCGVVATAEADENFDGMLTRILESFPLLDRVSDVLGSERLLEDYMVALKLEDPSASHQEVMKSLNDFMNTKLSPQTRDNLQRAFLETEVSAELGVSESSLYELSNILSAQPWLYNDILTKLKLSSQMNLSWDVVEIDIQQLIAGREPQLWGPVSAVLDDIQRGRGPSVDQYGAQNGTVYYNVGYTYEDYVKQHQAEAETMQTNFGTLNVSEPRREVTGQS
jgi:hypothetical protein